MASVRATAQCVGAGTGSLSVLRDLFGFVRGRVPEDPDSGTTAQVSLKEYLDLMAGDHFHVNIIRVGINLFSAGEVDDLDHAVYKTRNIFKTRNLGLGRVDHWDVTSGESDGLHIIANADDAEELTGDWSVGNDGVDVFIPHSITASFVGLSPRPGPCDKDGKGMTGAVSDKVRGPDRTARTFAHEIGHYLGLEHRNSSPTNLMAQTQFASNVRTSVLMTSGQGSTVRGHCSVDDGC